MNFAAQTVAAVTAVIVLVDYLLGVTLGMFGGLVFGSVRENRSMSLLEQAPDPISAGARTLLRLFIDEDDEYLRSLPLGGTRAPQTSRPGESGLPGQGVNR
jgi:hypothetical protein